MDVFDDWQKKAIDAKGGYFLVLAPPGCGKTAILSERVRKAMEDGVDVSDILCLTFTNRASRGMRDRISSKAGEDAANVFCGNIHKFCSNFIYENGIVPESACIADETEIADILLEIDSQLFASESGLPNKAAVQKVDEICSYILQRKLSHPQSAFPFSANSLEQYYLEAKSCLFDASKEFAHRETKDALILMEYKKAHDLISFSDILILAYDALLKDVDRKYRRYSWIQVDEVQDLNPLQLAIIDKLVDEDRNFTVLYLGDEQQAIFSFMGAKLEILSRLRQRCKGQTMGLAMNYRSPSYLLEMFNSYAENELKVIPADLPKPAVKSAKCPNDLLLVSNDSPMSELSRVVGMARHYLSFGNDKLAFLVPTNKMADDVSTILDKAQISNFKISGKDMFRTDSYKLFSSLITLSVNDLNMLSWTRTLTLLDQQITPGICRDILKKMRYLMLGPSDIIAEKSYIERFLETYSTEEIVFFDTETTGLDVLNDDIVQIAAYKVYKGKKVEGSDICLMIRTDRQIPKKLGNIENPLIDEYGKAELLEHKEALGEFLDYIGNRPVLGHNVMFDYQILKSNVRRYLGRTICLECFDSLHLIRLAEPRLRMYKLSYLLKRLSLEGQNSHLADEDIAATKAVVDYCVSKAEERIKGKASFLQQPETKRLSESIRRVSGLVSEIRSAMYEPGQISLGGFLEKMHKEMVDAHLIKPIENKFQMFLRYAQKQWDTDTETTLDELLCAHLTELQSGLMESDLISDDCTDGERVFIMTVYKGKGLEFDNVVILSSCDGIYPFFAANKVLATPERYSEAEYIKAKSEYMESARKFYVALTRSRKRICISYYTRNNRNMPSQATPFIRSIKKYFKD